jgi:hypothetical protein
MKWTEATTTSTGNQDDVDFSNADLLRCDNASLLTLRGLKAGAEGQRLTIVSVGAGQVDLSHQDVADATAANRLINIAASSVTSLAAGAGSATYVYDSVTARWRLVAHEQGNWIAPAFSAGDFTANGAMTWTVENGDVRVYYWLRGRSLQVSIRLSSTSVGGTLDTKLLMKIPGGFTAAFIGAAPAWIATNGPVREVGYAQTDSTGATQITFRRLAEGNWVADTNGTWIFSQLMIGAQ